MAEEEKNYLESISQSLALQTMKQILDVTTYKKLVDEFKKNPSKFTTLEEFMNKSDNIIAKVQRRIHDQY
ncbi:hypothetical protein ABLU29_09665 [Lactococcus lactis]|uniref:hypothetical protein n=1 Tax=Lactococcus lactis TaxID=1358 RepID=UPI003877A193